MAIAVDIVGGNSTDSQSVALGSLTNGALYVLTAMRATLSADRGVSSISYGGVGLSKVADFDNTAGSDRIRVTIWRLKNPASGSNTLAITPSGTPQSKIYGWISFSGVDQTTPEDAIGTGSTTTSNSPSSSVTTVTNGAYVIDVGLVDSGTSIITFNGTQTQIVNATNVNRRGYASYLSVPTAGLTTMSESSTTSSPWANISVAIRPDTGGGGAPASINNLMLMGMGT